MNSFKTFSVNSSLAVTVALLIACASFGISSTVANAADIGEFGDFGGASGGYYGGQEFAANNYYGGQEFAADNYYGGQEFSSNGYFGGQEFSNNGDYFGGMEFANKGDYYGGMEFSNSGTSLTTDTYDVYEALDTYAAQSYGSTGSFGGGSFGGGSTGGYSSGGRSGGSSFGGYSTPSFSSSGGCTTCHSQTPNYPAPVCITCNYPVPTPVPHPVPTCTTCGGSNVTNTNIKTTNTYTDNSINGSFNTNVHGDGNVVGGGYQGVAVATLAPVVPQHPIVYQQQIAAPYCVINLTNAGAYNAQATLVWSSSNAQNAYISQVGAVAPNGQRFVTGYTNQTYSLTVTGQGGTYTCNTQPWAPTYVAPTPINPSVSLTQIPYTGLALSPFAQAMYWLSLMSVAAAGGYLLVYYKGGALAFAGAALSRRQNHIVVSETSEQDTTEVEAPETENEGETEPQVSPVNMRTFLPTMAETQTRDAMQMIRNAAGVPQIIISRA